MKKNLKLATITTIIINGICLIINLICAHTTNKIPLGLHFPGGECDLYSGFGISLLKKYPMRYIGEMPETKIKISFDIISLLITLVLVFVITLIVIVIFNKLRNKKKKVENN